MIEDIWTYYDYCNKRVSEKQFTDTQWATGEVEKYVLRILEKYEELTTQQRKDLSYKYVGRMIDSRRFYE